MTDIIDVKKKIREILLADSQVKGVVDDRVYLGWLEEDYTLPCITIIDVTENGDVAELSGGMDEYDGLLQVDVWCRASASKSGSLLRDELAKAVKTALGKKANFQSMQSAGFILNPPTVRALDELGMKPPIYRKSLQFRVLYWTDSYA